MNSIEYSSAVYRDHTGLGFLDPKYHPKTVNRVMQNDLGTLEYLQVWTVGDHPCFLIFIAMIPTECKIMGCKH